MNTLEEAKDLLSQFDDAIEWEAKYCRVSLSVSVPVCRPMSPPAESEDQLLPLLATTSSILSEHTICMAVGSNFEQKLQTIIWDSPYGMFNIIACNFILPAGVLCAYARWWKSFTVTEH